MTLETVVCCMSIEQSNEANEMLLDTARGLRERGYDVVWSHVGDDALFNEELLSVCNFCYLHGRPHTGSETKDALKMAGQIGNQIKESMMHALAWNPRAIVYMEGDKNSFVPYVERLAQPILKGEADLAVATRSWDGFHAFPKVQQFWEGLFNLYAGFRAGFKTDWIYGPKAFTQETGSFMLDYKASDFGAIIHFSGALSVHKFSHTYSTPKDL